MPPRITRLILESLLALITERLDEYSDRKPYQLKNLRDRLEEAVDLPPSELHLP